jgi:ribose 5-phosphate isomerase B
MKIYFASDHAGFELKNKLVSFVGELGFETEDLGPTEFNPEDDYPEFISRASKKVAEDLSNSKAIILGKTGEGEAMVANRTPGIRAAVYYGGSINVVLLSREHNDSNMLSLGAGFLSEEEAREAVRLWLHTDFSGEERHVRRINQMQ